MISWLILLLFVDFGHSTQPFIIGGENAAITDLPFIVSVQYYSEHICGGSIVGADWILTSGNCVHGRLIRSTTVLLGTSSLDGAGVVHEIGLVNFHPDFESSSMLNDLALLRTIGTISFNDRMQPIHFTLSNTNLGEAEVAGWGATEIGGQYSRQLQKIKTNIVSESECEFVAYQERYQICTKNFPGQGECSGDNGNPLVLFEDGQYVQLGILSALPFNCDSSVAKIYTRVYAYRAWITDVLNSSRQSKRERV